MENILLKQKIVNLTDILLYFNHSSLRNIPKFVDKINQNPGYIFILNTYDNKVYVGEIIKISKDYEETAHCIPIDIHGIRLFIQIYESLQVYNNEILGMIYSKNQKENMGNSSFSVINTYKKVKFNFARPVIFNYDFLLEKELSKSRIDQLLEDSSFFNENNQNKIYGKFLEEDGFYCFSLMNKKMMQEDGMYSVELTNKNMQEVRKEIIGESNEAQRPYFYDFYVENAQAVQLKELILGEIYDVQITNRHYKLESDEEQIYGKLHFSASPLLEIPAKLIIKSKLSDSENIKVRESENLLRKILSEKKVNDTSLIGSKIMEKFPKTENVDFEVTIYNVGQGNWSKINAKGADGTSLDIIYDIGIGSSENISLTKQIARKAALDINDNHIFILSHWDLDHIKGVINLSDNQFNTIWIVPQLPDKLSFPAIRLALFLFENLKDDVVFVSDELYNKKIFSNQYISLGKGEGKGINQDAIRNGYKDKTSYSVNNNIGLVLCIKNNERKILFTGDCEYIQLPIEFLNDRYYAIVMSHHGAKIKYKDLLKIGMLPATDDGSKAYVCVGKSDKYPDSNHRCAIEKLKYEVIETRSYTDVDNQIKIHLPKLVSV